MIFRLLPLPNGYDSYIAVLNHILRYLVQHSPTYTTFYIWLSEQFRYDPDLAHDQCRLLEDLELITTEYYGISVSKTGLDYYHSERIRKREIITRQLLLNSPAVARLLGIFVIYRSTLTLDELREIYQTAFDEFIPQLQLEYPLTWLIELQLLEQVHQESYRATIIGEYAAVSHFAAFYSWKINDKTSFLSSFYSSIQIKYPVKELIDELNKASYDSKNPRRLELALVEAFRFLGFHAEHIGNQRGNSDVLIYSLVGPRSIRAILDAKSSKKGYGVVSIEGDAINRHKVRNAADAVVIVAREFSPGKVDRIASDNGFHLLKLTTLCELIERHAQQPLTLEDYRNLFQPSKGYVHAPKIIHQKREQREKYQQLIVDIVAMFTHVYNHGMNRTLTFDELVSLLTTKVEKVKFSEREIRQTLDLLKHPVIGILTQDETGEYALVTDRHTAAMIFRIIADFIDSGTTQYPIETSI
jgi:hypothetical protein